MLYVSQLPVFRNGGGSSFCSTASSTDLSVPPQSRETGGRWHGARDANPTRQRGGRVTPGFLFGSVSLDFPSERNSFRPTFRFTGGFLVVGSHGVDLKPLTDTYSKNTCSRSANYVQNAAPSHALSLLTSGHSKHFTILQHPTFTRSRTHSHTDSGVSHAGRQPAGQQQSG